MKFFTLTVLLLAAGLAQAEGAGSADQVLQRYPHGAIQSVEMADRAVAEVVEARKQVEATLYQQEQACAPQFMTTLCLDKAREVRRSTLARLRLIEVEANTFRRRAKVVERDNKLAEQNLKDEEAARRQEAAPDSVKSKKAEPKPAPAPAELAAEEKKRADNAAAYERRQKDAQQRLAEAEKRHAGDAAKAAENAAKAAAREADHAAKEASKAAKAKKEADKEAEKAAKAASAPAASVKPAN